MKKESGRTGRNQVEGGRDLPGEKTQTQSKKNLLGKGENQGGESQKKRREKRKEENDNLEIREKA